ncbi:unnamed protein product [Calicophoron daubneyi]|uniref:Uncharacterized protein n=1 Tax=Calicophoron daubneyi TaxID=300641 RepID=A0AAV2T3Y6_CALDB
MAALENRVIKSFDTVVNFDEDFHSGLEVSGNIDHSALSSEKSGALSSLCDTHLSRERVRSSKTVLTIHRTRGSSLQPVSFPKQSGLLDSSNKRLRLGISSSTERVLQDSIYAPEVPSYGLPQHSQSKARCYSPPERENGELAETHLNTRGRLSSFFPTNWSSEWMENVEDTHTEKLMAARRSSFDARFPSALKTRALSPIVSDMQCVSDNVRKIPLIELHSKSAEDLTQKSSNRKFDCEESMLTKVGLVTSQEHEGDRGMIRRDLKAEVYENELKFLRQRLRKRTAEAEKIAQELISVRCEEKGIKSRLTELAHNGLIKADTVSNLKNKISELYADVESLRSAHSQAIDHQADLREEIARLKRSRDWYAEQLRLVQSVRDRVQSESERLQGLLREGGDINHRLAHENACLQAQLACSRASLADAKRNLSHQLESIRIDMIEREAIFERIANERSSLEKITTERASQVNNLQAQIRNLQAQLKASDEQVESQRKKLDRLEAALQGAETKHGKLQEAVVDFEQQRHAQEAKLDQQIADYENALSRIEELEKENTEKNKLLSAALEEKASLTSALASASKEKETMNSYLSTLKDNLARIEESFEKVRQELNAKSSQLTELINQRGCLTDQIRLLEIQLQRSLSTIEELNRDKEELSLTVERLRAEVLRYRDDLAKPNRAVEKADIEVQASRHITPLCSSVAFLRTSLKDQEKIENQSRQFIFSKDESSKQDTPPDNLALERIFPTRLAFLSEQTTASGRPPKCMELTDVPAQYESSTAHRSNGHSLADKRPLSIPQDEDLAQISGQPFAAGEDEVCGKSELAGAMSTTCWDKSSSIGQPAAPLNASLGSSNQVNQTAKRISSFGLGTVTYKSSDDGKSLKPENSPDDQIGVPRTMRQKIEQPCNEGSFPILINQQAFFIRSQLDVEVNREADVAKHANGTSKLECQVPSLTFADSKPDILDGGFSELEAQSTTEQNSIHLGVSDDPLDLSDIHLIPGRDHNNAAGRPTLSPTDELEAQFSSCGNNVIRSDEEPSLKAAVVNNAAVEPNVRLEEISCLKNESNVPCFDSRHPTYKIQSTEAVMGGNSGNFCSTVKTAGDVELVRKIEYSPESSRPYSLTVPPPVIIDSVKSYYASPTLSPTEKETFVKAIYAANKEIAKVVADLTIARREIAVETAKAEREAFAHQRAVEERDEVVAELSDVKAKLCELNSEYEDLQREYQQVRDEVDLLRNRHDTSSSNHLNEIEALRAIIKTTTDHLSMMSSSLREANREKVLYQSELARLRGSIRAQLERYRLFSRIGSTTPGEGSQQVIASLNAVGFDWKGFEKLLGENASCPLSQSKPLRGLNKCFEGLQNEINKLDDEIVNHAMAVHDAVGEFRMPDKDDGHVM